MTTAKNTVRVTFKKDTSFLGTVVSSIECPDHAHAERWIAGCCLDTGKNGHVAGSHKVEPITTGDADSLTGGETAWFHS